MPTVLQTSYVHGPSDNWEWAAPTATATALTECSEMQSGPGFRLQYEVRESQILLTIFSLIPSYPLPSSK